MENQEPTIRSFNKPNPTLEEQTARRNALIGHLAKLGLTPEDVPRAMEELRTQLRAELERVRNEEIGDIA